MSTSMRAIPTYFLQPLRLLTTYDRNYLRPDLIAGLTVGVILLPQAIAFALIANLPPEMGLYTAVVGAIVGALWSSSSHSQTGPTSALSLLVLSSLSIIAVPDTPEFFLAAGVMAVMAGVLQLVMGMAGLGVLINFISHSVIVGFAAGAGIRIAAGELRHLLGLQFTSRDLVGTLRNIVLHLPDTHIPTLALGVGTIMLIVLLHKLNPHLPGTLIGLIVASVVLFLLRLDEAGVAVMGRLPSSLPPLTALPVFDLDLLARLSAGALAVAAIGLIQTMAVARSLAVQTQERLNNNQEFVAQGLANIAVGFLSGFPCSGSFSRSAVNYRAGAHTPVAAVFSGLFVLVAMLTIAPLGAYLPRTSLAGVLIITAYGMIDREEIVRIWRGAPGDAVIMLVTLLGTLFLHIEFAVLVGILISFAVYIMRTSTPRVYPVLPDDEFRHLIYRPDKPACPQLGIIDILGDLYFGAVSHVEDAIYQHMAGHPEERFLLLRMHSVQHCDFTGIHALESIMQAYRERGGDLFLVRVRKPVLDLMKSTGFYDNLGADHFLPGDEYVTLLFYKVLDPAICIYECDVRAFRECQNLPKRIYPAEIVPHTEMPANGVKSVAPQELWQQLHNNTPPLVVDVREPREFKQGHIPQAKLIPLLTLLSSVPTLPHDRPIVLVCRSGRRSTRAAHVLSCRGYDNVSILQGGMLAWEAAGLLEALN